MTLWILVLTHTIHLLSVSVPANTQFFLFTSQAACEQARPAVHAHAMDLAPTRHETPMAFSLTGCLEQPTVTPDALIAYLEHRAKRPAQGQGGDR